MFKAEMKYVTAVEYFNVLYCNVHSSSVLACSVIIVQDKKSMSLILQYWHVHMTTVYMISLSVAAVSALHDEEYNGLDFNYK